MASAVDTIVALVHPSPAARIAVPVNTNAWNRVRYTLLAPVYDRVAGFRAQRRRSLELLAPRPGERVLVVGCGTGLDLEWIPRGVEVVAGDLTPAMVERTRARAGRLGRPVEARVMDAQALGVPDASFDAAVLHLVLAVVPDPVAAIREAERVLRPGGRAAVFDKWVPDDGAPSPARRLLNLAANLVATDVTRRLGDLVASTGLGVEHREPAGGGGFFSIALLRKPGPPA
ncbi:MAG: methyltransferase domain-containing protein [Longimicrobiaceae bacterium]